MTTKIIARKIKTALEKAGFPVCSALACQSNCGTGYYSLLINTRYQEPTDIKKIASLAGNVTVDKIIVYFATQTPGGE